MSRRIQRSSSIAFLVLSLIPVLALFAAAQDAAKPQAARGHLSPEQAMKEMRIADGLKIELVAAEPEIESPVEMAFDEDGKLWVVEMRDYPNGPAPGELPQGRIKILEDRDGDGRYETSRVFADQLSFANGLLPWDGGVIVTAAPNIMFLKDTDGDGVADVKKVLYEGFAALNPQLRVSHPVLGLDGWIYVANGLRGGQVIKAGDKDDKPINLSGMDFRFNMLTGEAEAISGMGQFGNTFDDWGNRFVCDNRHHLRHVVMPNHYIKRNPNLAVPEVLEDISEIEESFGGAGAKIYPLSKNWTTSNLHAGRFTAACGVFIYRGDLLPEYRGCAFTCDPTGNLVHGERMTPHGATFRSKPLKAGVEFLATPDEWTRPVSLAHGPDGALYIVDMARAVIEHPEFMPTELKNRPDLVIGKDKGRIWRIVPTDKSGINQSANRPLPPTKAKSDGVIVVSVRKPDLGGASTFDLVAQLANPNAWHRETAQRLLLTRQDKKCIDLLKALFNTTNEPRARIAAAWLLQAYGEVNEQLVMFLLHDERARVREVGVQFAEKWLAKSELIQKRVFALAQDADPRLRFQIALSVNPENDKKLSAIRKIALNGAKDRWTRFAVESAITNQGGELIEALFRNEDDFDWSKDQTTAHIQLIQEVSSLTGAAKPDRAELERLFMLIFLHARNRDTKGIPLAMAAINGLATGLERRGSSLSAALFSQLKGDEHPAWLAWYDRLLSHAMSIGMDRQREVGERVESLRLLAHDGRPQHDAEFVKLISDDPLQEVRLAAVRVLAARNSPAVPTLLMQSWKSYTPAVRREVTEAMLRQPERIKVFFDEIEAGRVKPGDVDALRTRQLTQHNRADIRDRAKKLLETNLPPERKQVMENYKAALTLKGDAQNGKAIFQKNCATCHRVGGVGVDVGADIADTRSKTPDLLMTNILNPNQAIDSNYINYVVLTKSGKVLTGIIAAETASSITLKRAENQTEVVLRQEIEELESTGQSLMPEGLEKNIPVQEMADLLSFLKNWRYLDGSVPAQN